MVVPNSQGQVAGELGPNGKVLSPQHSSMLNKYNQNQPAFNSSITAIQGLQLQKVSSGQNLSTSHQNMHGAMLGH